MHLSFSHEERPIIRDALEAAVRDYRAIQINSPEVKNQFAHQEKMAQVLLDRLEALPET